MSTPALDRAKDAFVVTHDARADDPSLTYSDFLDLLLRDAVSAALLDLDDPDWLARVIYDAHGFHSADSWDTDHDGVRNHYRSHADAVRAAILGETKNNEREN